MISDKISSVLMYVPELLLHVSRGVRWDSDHVVTLDRRTAGDRPGAGARGLPRVECTSGSDFFDASINRVAAWVIGTRNMLKAAAAWPCWSRPNGCAQRELAGDFTGRLALMEEQKTLPSAAVWDYYCLQAGVPVGAAWLDEVRHYERDVLSQRVTTSANVS